MTLREIFNQTNIKPYRIADAIGMSRSYIYKLLGNGLPPSTRLATLERIANELGYRVKVEFEPLQEEANK